MGTAGNPDTDAQRRLGRTVPLLLGLVVACAYANGLRVGFHFDDSHVIEHNVALRTLANVPRFFTDPSASTASPDNRVIRPLLLTTFALNYAISGLAPWSYHLVNLLLHWLAVVLIFRIVRDHLWLGDAALPVATVAALVVATHPLNTSAVDYVSARSAVLATVFYLGAFDAAARSRRGLAVVCLALSLLTKEIGFTLPLVVLAHARLGGRRPPWRLLAMLTAVAAAGIGYRALLLPPSVMDAMHGDGVTPWIYCMTGWSAYLYYLRLFVWPDRLVIDRLDYPLARSLADPQAWVSLLALVAIGLAAWSLRHGSRALTFATAWFFLTLAAESTLFPLAEPVNEHRPYLAMLGFGTAAALGLQQGAALLARALRAPRVATFAVVAASLTTALGSATYARNTVWQSDYDLWVDATRKAPASTRAWTNAGHAALARNQLAEARELLMHGYALAPCYRFALLNLSALERRVGDGAAALRWADEGVRCNPDFALAHYYRAAALAALGRDDDAIASYRRTTELDPAHADAWSERARLLERHEAWADAAVAYDHALAADPQRADAAVGAGVIYQYRLGRSDLAVERFRTALAAVPTHYGAHYQLAVALLATGREAEAFRAWEAFVPLAETIGDHATLDAAPERLRHADRTASLRP